MSTRVSWRFAGFCLLPEGSTSPSLRDILHVKAQWDSEANITSVCVHIYICMYLYMHIL